uniref:von Willebrand factor A domain-containing protein 1 n=1 Tax=Fundulus heteroclitus TaxID=8078 RepID=A0A3Q2NXP1_FUNHE
MKSFLLLCVLIFATLQRSFSQTGALPDTELDRCEGDILLLLDSSGSVTTLDFSRFLIFVANLLHPFSLGRGHVRVALVLVGTEPHLEFDLDVHGNQESLLRALQSVRQLQGDTNTEAAVGLARRLLLLEAEGDVPKVLLWVTDGVQPGDVEGPMSELKARGVRVLIVSTIHGDYRVLRRVATPPLESHLHFVDIESIDIIVENLREAIIKIICAERLSVVHLTSHSAVLQWSPVLAADGGYYVLTYKPVGKLQAENRTVLSSTSSRVELTKLQPDTTYTASLHPDSNQRLFSTLSVNFTTLPDVLSPAEVTVSDSGPRQIRVSWGPLQPARVQRYIVEYGAFPSGRVQTVTVSNQKSSVILRDLEPGTQYLITVSALHADGRQRAMSVRSCTQEAARPALTDLQLALMDRWEGNEVQASWQADTDGLKGYWVSWERKDSQSSQSESSPSSAYLPPSTPSIRLTHLAPNSRVCVSPVYSSGRGEGICCTAKTGGH